MKKIVMLGIIVLLLISSAFIYAKNMDVEQNVLGNDEITCQVRVDDDIFSDMDIVKVSCVKTGKCYSIFSFMSLNPFVVEGIVRMKGSDGVIYGKKSFETTIGMGENIEFKSCVPVGVSSAEIQIVNEQGGVEDSRGVTW